MKRKIFLTVLALICSLCCMFSLAACGDAYQPSGGHTHNYQWVDNGDGTHKQHCQSSGCDALNINTGYHDFTIGDCICGAKKPIEQHTHAYNKQIAESKYIKTEATCISKAVYYNSCECGEVNNETFEYGEFAPHTFDDWQEEVPASHTASGTKGYKDCKVCKKHFDENGTTEIIDLTIPQIHHKFYKQVIENEYLASEATCINKATYYYSCECGEKGSDTFIYGDFAWHNFNEEDFCTVCSVHKFSEGIEYTLSADGTYYILTGIGECTDTKIYIADAYGEDSIPVTHIGASAFRGNSTLKSIAIPQSITHIGAFAFMDCDALEGVYITDVSVWAEMVFGDYRYANPLYYAKNLYLNGKLLTEWGYPEGTVTISPYAFSYCQSLKNITIPDSVTEIGENAFSGCSIETAVMPSLAVPYVKNTYLKSATITSGYETNTFKDCTNLEKVVLRDSISKISYQAFYNCTSLIEVEIPASVFWIERQAFVDCSSLKSLTLPNNITNLNDNAFRGCSSLTEINIPTGIRYIDLAVFSGCSSLINITLPEGIEYISKSAFTMCKSLSTINIPYGVNSIGDAAFSYCNSLKYISLPDSVTEIGDLAFAGCGFLNLSLPKNITIIGEAVFNNCKDLSEIIIPDKIISIGNNAFAGCSSLTNLILPEQLISIGERAFADCVSIRDLLIPYSVKTIGKSAFWYCSNLSTINLPNGLKEIGESAFYGCKNLLYVHIDNIDAWFHIAFGNEFGNPLYYANELYVNYNGAILLISEIIVPEDVTVISDYLFYNCAQIKSLNIHAGVTEMGSHSFAGCSIQTATIPAFAISYLEFDKDNLSGIEINSGEEIPEAAFEDCLNLYNVKLPSSLRSIGKDAFKSCTKLFNVSIENADSWWRIKFDNEYANPVYYSNQLYINNELFNSLTVPEDVTTIGDYLFYNCSQFDSLTIHDNVTQIGVNAFAGCNQIKMASMPAFAIPYIDRNALRTVIITSGDSICDFAFRDSYITSIDLCYGITTIGDSAFENCTWLATVTIPDSVTEIGESAFENCHIKDIKLPAFAISHIYKPYLESVEITSGESIEDSAFYNCRDLTSIIVPDTLKFVGANAFCVNESLNYNEYDNGLYLGNFLNPYVILVNAKSNIINAIVINENTKFIYQNAFNNCRNLTSITIPEGIISIDKNAFDKYGSRLTEIRYIGDLTRWCNFSGLSNLMNFASSNIKLYINNQEIKGELVIPNGVTSICDYAFNNCSGLTSIIIPEGVTSIGNYALNNCSGLTSITIPEGVKSIGAGAFYGCGGLTGITIPEGVTSIGDSAFYGCGGLTSIIIPEGVKSIGAGAFYGCSRLTGITIPEGVTSIGDSAFYGCSGLTGITIPEGVTSIGDSAFYGCSGLTSITIPDSVTSIGDYAFYKCKHLTNINLPNTLNFIGDNTFYQCAELINIIIPEGVVWIGSDAFSGCNCLESVTIPGSLTSIGRRAFDGCTKLAYIYFVGDIADWCTISGLGNLIGSPSRKTYFNNQEITGKLEIPDSVTSIGDYAFYNCSGLTSVIIPESVTSIGDYAFYNCSGLTSVIIPESVTSIGNAAFYNCSGLTSITIPGSVTSIDNKFNGCSATEIRYTGDIVGWCNIMGLGALMSTSSSHNLKLYINNQEIAGKLVIPEGVTSIRNSAFSGCSGLTSVTIPDSVTDIGYCAFFACSGLTSVIIPNSVTDISNSAFSGCSGLTSITFDGTKEQWNAITNHSSWDVDNCTIHCTDGDIVKS